MFRLPSGPDFGHNHAMAEKLGETLLSVGAISASALNRALLSQRSTGGRLGTVLLEQGLVTEDTLARALSRISKREYAYPNEVLSTPQEIIALVPPKLAIRCQAVPFGRDGRILKVAMRDPNDLAAADELSFVTGKKIEPYVTSELRIAEALERFYGERRPARFRALAERLARGAPQAVIPAPPAAPPPPPPNPYRPAASTPLPLTPVLPEPPPRGAASSPEIWRGATPTAQDPDDIEIETWRPEPLLTPVAFVPPPAPSPEALEIELAPPKRPAPISFEEALARMLAAESRDDIADAVIDHFRESYERIALFIARKDDVIGWNAHGEGISRSSFKSVRIPYSQPSIFLNGKISGGYYQGPLPALPAHQSLIEALGHRPQECALLPVAIKKRVVAFLYVEPKGTTVPPEKVNDLRKVAAAMADSFARLALKMKRGRETA
jgi:hypothetical protein